MLLLQVTICCVFCRSQFFFLVLLLLSQNSKSPETRTVIRIYRLSKSLLRAQGEHEARATKFRKSDFS